MSMVNAIIIIKIITIVGSAWLKKNKIVVIRHSAYNM